MDNHHANHQSFESTSSASTGGEVRFGGYGGSEVSTRFNQFTPMESVPQSTQVNHGADNMWNRVGGGGGGGGGSIDEQRGF